MRQGVRMKWWICFLLAGIVGNGVGAAAWRETALEVPEPAREFRAAWVTSVYNLDWPSRPGLGKERQQAELCTLLDGAVKLGLNAVLLQVRPGGDALYDSPLEPWSAVLTGKSGGNPGYDPLTFAVQEAHRRGLELHAWFNPFRAKTGKAAMAARHWTVQHPEWLRGEKAHLFMDPGVPEVQSHVLAVVRDVLARYDVDGIHIDDYFYPYPVLGPGGVRMEVPLGDETRWQKEHGGQSLADWRRANINRFVQSLYVMTKSVKPAARVGISPFGIWQPGVPEGIEARVNAFEHLYADSRHWLQEGWCDYLAPQLYWPIQPAPQSFTTLLDWWTAQSKGRPVWPGMAVDRIANTREPMLPLTELTDQMAAVRRTAPVPGAVLWRIKFLINDPRGVGTLLREQCYAARALPPAAPWLGPQAPGKPLLEVVAGPESIKLSWSATGGSAIRWWSVQTRRAGQWSQEPPVFKNQSGVTLPNDLETVAVRGISESGMASAPVVWKLSGS